MNATPFNADELQGAKQAFAEAFNAERLRNPFAEPDPFRAALTIWNEDNGQLPRALWVAHAAKWHKDPDVIAFVDEAKEQAKAANNVERLTLIRDKTALKEHLLMKLVSTLDLTFEPKDVKELANEIAKYAGLHEAPADDLNTGRIIGVIQHELKPVDAAGVVVPFDERVRSQQRALQGQVAAFEIELEGGDNARLVN